MKEKVNLFTIRDLSKYKKKVIKTVKINNLRLGFRSNLSSSAPKKEN